MLDEYLLRYPRYIAVDGILKGRSIHYVTLSTDDKSELKRQFIENCNLIIEALLKNEKIVRIDEDWEGDRRDTHVCIKGVDPRTNTITDFVTIGIT